MEELSCEYRKHTGRAGQTTGSGWLSVWQSPLLGCTLQNAIAFEKASPKSCCRVAICRTLFRQLSCPSILQIRHPVDSLPGGRSCESDRQEKRPLTTGRLLIAPNHTFQMDFAVTRTALPCHYTQIAKQAEVQGARALVAAWVGTIAAKVEGGTAKPGQGAAVVGCYSASHCPHPPASLPAGKLVYDNVLRPEDFRTGAARTMSMAVEQLGEGENGALLPVGIDYKRDPEERFLLRAFCQGSRAGHTHPWANSVPGLMSLVIPTARRPSRSSAITAPPS